jgi:hypothetical protein
LLCFKTTNYAIACTACGEDIENGTLITCRYLAHYKAVLFGVSTPGSYALAVVQKRIIVFMQEHAT